jgi:hypothetical protein
MEEIVSTIKETGKLQKPMEIAHKWGINPNFTTFLVKNKFLIKNGTSPYSLYYTLGLGRTDLTPQDILFLRNEFYISLKTPKKEKKGDGVVQDIPKNNKFAEIETKELFAELKRRGYSGELKIVTTKTLKL